MAGLISKALSAVVATVYLVAAAMSGEAEVFVMVAISLLLPLACIWFGEEIGGLTGVVRGHLVTSESPGCLVAAGGWLLLLLPVIVGVIWYLQEQGQ